MSRQEKGFYEFGPFRLDPGKRVLLRGDETVALTPKAFSTLLAMVERRGEVVEKDTLIQIVWPDTFITEATLTQNVFRLRKALGEEAGDHRFIVTVPGRGYSFVADVLWIEPAPDPVEEVPQVKEVPEPAEASAPASFSATDEMPLAALLAPASGELPLPVPAEPAAVRHRPPHRLWTAALALGLALLAMGLLFLRAGPRRQTASNAAASGTLAARPPRRSVAVLGFRNLSGRPDAAWLSTALAEMFTVELGVGEKLQTISGETVARARMDLALDDVANPSPATLERVRAMLGCDVVLIGSYLDLGGQAGGKVRVDLRLQDTATGETLAVVTRTRMESELFELVSDLGMELRKDLGGGLVPQEQAIAARASFPGNREAAQPYAEGLQHLRTLDALTARDRLLRAIEAQPDFPLAHANLAIAWTSLGYDSKAEEEAGRALALSSSLSREDRLLVEGLHEETRKNWARAVEIYKTLYTVFPDDPEHGLRLAHAQIAAGRAKEAVATLAALRRQSSDPRIDLTEAEAAKALSDYRRTELLAARAAHRGEELGARLLMARAFQTEAYAERSLGKLPEALANVQKSARIFGEAGDRTGIADSLFDNGNLLKDQGDLAGARRLFEQAFAIHRDTGNQRGSLQVGRHLGNIAAQLGDVPRAKQYLGEAARIADEINDRLGHTLALTSLAALQRSEGELEAAARSLHETRESFHAIGNMEGEGAALVNLAGVLRDQGNLPAAQQQAAAALRLLREIGHSRGTGFALGQLGGLLADQGDLDGAQAAYRELGEIGRATGVKNLQADASAGLALIQALRGNLPAARRNQELALALRQQSHDSYDVADSRLAMAQLALEEGNAVAAGRDASMAAEQLHDLHLHSREALAHATLARALLAQGQTAAAEQALRKALDLTARSEDRWVRLAVLTVAGRIAGETGRAAEGRSLLAMVRDEAKSRGLWIHRLEATLALGQLELRHGDARVGRLTLEALSREATQKGYLLVARRAGETLGHPAQPPLPPRAGLPVDAEPQPDVTPAVAVEYAALAPAMEIKVA